MSKLLQYAYLDSLSKEYDNGVKKVVSEHEVHEKAVTECLQLMPKEAVSLLEEEVRREVEGIDSPVTLRELADLAPWAVDVQETGQRCTVTILGAEASAPRQLVTVAFYTAFYEKIPQGARAMLTRLVVAERMKKLNKE